MLYQANRYQVAKKADDTEEGQRAKEVGTISDGSLGVVVYFGGAKCELNELLGFRSALTYLWGLQNIYGDQSL